jgi:hypothetical protein
METELRLLPEPSFLPNEDVKRSCRTCGWETHAVTAGGRAKALRWHREAHPGHQEAVG